MQIFLLSAFVIIALMFSGCSKKKAKPVEAKVAPEPVVEEVEFVAPVAVKAVAIDEKKTAAIAEPVIADFNLDGLDDMAVVESGDESANNVSVYIQQPSSSVEKSDNDVSGIKRELNRRAKYFKVGSIKGSIGSKIIGIASKRNKKYTDLIILSERTDKSTEMVYYKNQGDKFIKVPYMTDNSKIDALKNK